MTPTDAAGLRHRPLKRVALWIGGVSLTLVGACGLGIAGTGEGAALDGSDDASVTKDAPSTSVDGTAATDASTINDAGADSPSTQDADAAPLPTYACGGAAVASCSVDCPGLPSICSEAGACVATCASDCPGFRIACFRCNEAGVDPVGTCEEENDASYCMNSDYAPGSACSCAGGDPSTCLGEYQKCVQDDAGDYGCHSCGEPSTKGGAATCKNGKMCDFGGSPTDHLTCH